MLNKEELQNIVGGAISAAFLNGIFSGIKVIADLARSLGTAIRRIQYNNLC
jgi:bacteriocin-like protein